MKETMKPIPTSVLLNPSGTELYRQWQVEAGPWLGFNNKNLRCVVNAQTWCEFKNWYIAQQAVQEADVEPDPMDWEPTSTTTTSAETKASGLTAEDTAARKCGRALHPLAPVNDGYCPVCKVGMCLGFQEDINTMWDLVGGPAARGVVPAHVESKWRDLKRAWRFARTELANLQAVLQDQADAEAG
jgi:hypothetical protein